MTIADNKSLMKEKDMMSRAHYTYVLRLLGLYEMEGRTLCNYGLVMEYMPHGSVCTLFKRVDNVPWALRFQILHQVALGMNYLHHRLDPPIIHRDLKPHNVLLNKSLDVQLTDFGLAKNVETDSSSQSMVGTVSYMPPEALKSLTYKPTKEFDVYSFAIFTWSVLSGREPYEDVGKEMIKMLIPQDQKHRPDLNLVTQKTSQKMVPEAIQLMQESWDADPGKRPMFSAIINRTKEMNKGYAGEIDNVITQVLNQLKKHSQSSDISDGAIRSDVTPCIPDTFTISVNVFREVLQQVERGEAQIHNTSVPSSQDIVDAEDFLLANFSQIVQAKPDLSDVLDVLFSKGTIIEEELDIIKHGSVQEQIRKTLHNIMSKGKGSCMEFLQLMKRFHPGLMTSLISSSHPGGE
ncbi:receptor-interacting serine/threonine-protein kinase 2-like isoform X2 [Dendropsophus ebraccatus]|uniref:receptor-interacting serine/threonine-protein kinase 2-like isoform X2 n=1 Tax=Dendropsophus ebraccatus TaxID=150705 RepID=UPI003830FD99